MKFCVLMASPRLNGNTAELVKPFITRGCYACQNISDEYGCVQQDNTAEIMKEVIKSDCISYTNIFMVLYSAY